MNLEGKDLSYDWGRKMFVKWENLLPSQNKGQNKKSIVMNNKDLVRKKTNQDHSVFSDPASRRTVHLDRSWAPLLMSSITSPMKQTTLLASVTPGVCSLCGGRGVPSPSVITEWGPPHSQMELGVPGAEKKACGAVGATVCGPLGPFDVPLTLGPSLQARMPTPAGQSQGKRTQGQLSSAEGQLLTLKASTWGKIHRSSSSSTLTFGGFCHWEHQEANTIFFLFLTSQPH